MYLLKKYNSHVFKNLLTTLPKKEIFSMDINQKCKQLSSFYDIYDESRYPFMKEFIDYNLMILKKNNIKIKNDIFIENRDYMFETKDDIFEGKLHQDSFQDSGNSCYTSVYYYKIDKDIKGGNLVFPPFGQYKPKENDLIFFDGDVKHKVGKTFGIGIRGTVICNFQKSLI